MDFYFGGDNWTRAPRALREEQARRRATQARQLAVLLTLERLSGVR